MTPRDQRVHIAPAVEAEKAHPRPVRQRSDSGPVRCQLWDGNRHVATVPVIFDDMGHPSDVRWKTKTVERVTKLVFMWAARPFVFHLPEPVTVLPGQPLHLALHHLKLTDRYGRDVLAAGR